MDSSLAQRLAECIFSLQPITLTEAERRPLVGEVELLEFKPAFLAEIRRHWHAILTNLATIDQSLPRRDLVYITDGSQSRLFPDLVRGPAVYILQRFSDKEGYYATVRCILAPALQPIAFVDPPINEQTGKPVLYD